MVRLLKLPKQKKLRPKYAYVLPKNGVMYSEQGDPIIFVGRDKHPKYALPEDELQKDEVNQQPS